MLAKLKPLDLAGERVLQAESLNARYGELSPEEIIELSVRQEFSGEIAAVSSFGADSAVLLNMIADVDRSLPVLFLDTGKHFEETLGYRDALVTDFGLRNVEVLHPDPAALAGLDPDGTLHQRDTDACCEIRKVEPMARGLAPYAAWFTGRKRFQAATRNRLDVFEAVGERIRINPLAAGRHRTLPTICAPRRCARIRWWPMAICRSAASPAPSLSSRARMHAAAAGRARRRLNAAST